jgi:hypothetical protein
MACDSSKLSTTAVAAFFAVATMPCFRRAFFRAVGFLAALGFDRAFVLRFVRVRADALALADVFRALAMFSLQGSAAAQGRAAIDPITNTETGFPRVWSAERYFGATAADCSLPVSVSMKAMMSCRSCAVN